MNLLIFAFFIRFFYSQIHPCSKAGYHFLESRGTCYFTGIDGGNWANAESYCNGVYQTDHGINRIGNLATVQHKDQHDFVRDNLSPFFTNGYSYVGTKYITPPNPPFANWNDGTIFNETEILTFTTIVAGANECMEMWATHLQMCACVSGTTHGSICQYLVPICDGFYAYNGTIGTICTGHGYCFEDELCTCYDGNYNGQYCQNWTCNGIERHKPNACSGHGTCDGHDDCNCNLGYDDSDCSYWECNDMSRHNVDSCLYGNCYSPDNCTCNYNEYCYSGEGKCIYGSKCNEIVHNNAKLNRIHNNLASTYVDKVQFEWIIDLNLTGALVPQIQVSPNNDTNNNTDTEELMVIDVTCSDYIIYTGAENCIFVVNLIDEETVYFNFTVAQLGALTASVNDFISVNLFSMTENANILIVDERNLPGTSGGFPWDIFLYIAIPIAAVIAVLITLILLAICIIITFFICRDVKKKNDLKKSDPAYIALKEVKKKKKKEKLDDFENLPSVIDIELTEYMQKDVAWFKEELEKANNYEVHLVEVFPKKEERLLKLFKFEKAEDVEAFRKDFEITCSSCHKNSVLYLGAYTQENDTGLLCMKYENGSLHNFFKERKKKKSDPLPFKLKVRMLSEICDALQFFHISKKKVIKNLSPKLIFLTEEMRVKVDYGFTQQFLTEDDFANSAYTAPELIKKELLSNDDSEEGLLDPNLEEKADVFSFGILMHVVMTEQIEVFPPTENELERQYGRKISEDTSFRPSLTDEIIQKSKTPVWFVDLMKSCWWEKPEDRPTVAHLKEVIYVNTKKAEDEERKRIEDEIKQKEEEKLKKAEEKKKRKIEEKKRKEEEKRKKAEEKKRKKEEAARKKAEEKKRREDEKRIKDHERIKKKEEELRKKRMSKAMSAESDKKIEKIRLKNIKLLEKNKKTKEIRICVVGDGAVGKTCLLHVYTTGKFTEDYLPTVFENYQKKQKFQVNRDKEFEFDLALMDTAGQEDYAELRKLSYENVDIFILCFSVIMKESLNNIRNKDKGWVKDLSEYCEKNQIILCGMQIDLREDKSHITEGNVIQMSECEKVAKKLGLAAYVECSSKENLGITEVFLKAIDVFLNIEQKKGKKK